MSVEIKVYDFIESHSKPLRLAIAGVISWTGVACSGPYTPGPQAENAVPIPVTTPVLELAEPGWSGERYQTRGVYDANQEQREGILKVAQVLINPAFFPNGIKLMNNRVDYHVNQREAKASAATETRPPQGFTISNRYAEDGSILENRIFLGVEGARSSVIPSIIPGLPLGEDPYQKIRTNEGLVVFANSVVSLPELMNWEFGPTSYIPYMSPDTRPRLAQMAVGTGYDAEGKLYVVNADDTTALSLAVFPKGQVPR